jgi:hypothetical protein
MPVVTKAKRCQKQWMPSRRAAGLIVAESPLFPLSISQYLSFLISKGNPFREVTEEKRPGFLLIVD